MTVEIWPATEKGAERRPDRLLGQSMLRGLACRCPACGKGKIFGKYLKVNAECDSCGEALHHQRADDAPPYFTIVIVGHVIVPLALFVEMGWHPPVAWQLAVYLPLVVILSLILLPMIKGAVIGWQWANYMHGFDPDGPIDEDKTYVDGAELRP